ncbi:aldehyde dehydrogenase family protein [Blastococcus tunisiensis]|uniref:Betaine-aldehyde dehydrogenase n=1 Tax=Blastococcus tunisiensis TaxID=1798228 RepID=A0A1I2H2K5_9ACTN|nr:aldehyde dehydrogenase family protein [Blastococcus sp. DSM 46838]SFF24474.1 betaine-aldehyde dehydrogenase [Blastococcus sp. DSM 46838]
MPPTATPGSGAPDRLMLIDGKLCASAGGGWLTAIDPSNEEVLGRVPEATAEDVEQAVLAADRAAPAWAATPALERARLVRELARRALDRADELLELEVRDTGNTRRRMVRDVTMATDLLEYFAGLALEIKGETVPSSPTGLHFSVREPYGVVGRILAFNHPFYFAASRLAAPLVAGNTVVLKPSEEAPLSTTVLAELCAEIFPPGVVNIVTGTGIVAGAALVRHPRVKRLTFIGSVPTGRAIQRQAAESAVKHVSLELGGKNPMIVFPDADPEKVATAAVAGMNFGHQGQSCGSTSRLLLHEDLYEDVLARVVEKVSALRLGDPTRDDTDMGPLNNARHLQNVIGHVAAAEEDGARLMTGGRRPGGAQFERGFWLQPTVFADVTPEMRLFRSEVFGPVLAVSRWSDVDDLFALANGVDYGLTASIWTNDLNRGLVAARAVQAGYVWINGNSTHFPGTGFGGRKESGTGSEEGLDELLSFTEVKTINVALPAQLT